MAKRNKLFISFLVVAILFIILSAVAWRVARSSVASEGYHTNEAAWNRVLYLENEDGDFDRYDNGVLQERNFL